MIHLLFGIYDMTKLAIITVTYNSAEVVEGFLNSLLQQTKLDWNLYLVDSASSDNSCDLVLAYADSRITLLPQNTNVGFAKGNNLGIKRAIQDGATDFLLINNDTEFPAEFLSQLLTERGKYPNEILTTKIYYFEQPNLIWSAGGGFKPHQAWAAYHIGDNEIDNGQYDQDYACDFVPMCCVLIPLSIWNQVGELDEKYFIYSEDADWFYRAKNARVRLQYCHTPIIYHKVSSLTGGASSKIGASYGTRNRIYFICKHFHGILRVQYLATYFFGMLYKLLTKKYTCREFMWRLKAYFAGLKL